jgi:hypothetical protein
VHPGHSLLVSLLQVWCIKSIDNLGCFFFFVLPPRRMNCSWCYMSCNGCEYEESLPYTVNFFIYTLFNYPPWYQIS